MTEPTTDDLDAAEGRELSATIAKLLGRKVIFPFPDKPTSYLDWNALAAARAKLEGEREDMDFERLLFQESCVWQILGMTRFSFLRGDLASEALALACCIKAASDDRVEPPPPDWFVDAKPEDR